MHPLSKASRSIGRRLLRFWYSFSTGGLLLGTLFYAASLTPSLVPRTFFTQGALAGCSFAVGYGLGVLAVWLWTYMELPILEGRVLRIFKLIAAVICAFVAIAFLWQTTQWQNSIRELMKLEPVTSANSFEVGLIALVTFGLILALARLFLGTSGFVSARVHGVMPRRISNVVGVVIAVTLFWLVINGVFLRIALDWADASLQKSDTLIDPETRRPTALFKTGSSASLIKWEDLGRTGRQFISAGPTREDISTFSGKPALEPVRVYVGLRSAETPQARARLALEELKRVGGFERSVLIIVTPTGSGWIDPAALESVEYLHGGDVASVAVQYSYLSSPLSLLVEPDNGANTARALFTEIYSYWTKLPRDKRPKLYLHGLSLGAKNSALSMELFEVLGDPVQGALWSGPPYISRFWRSVTDGRNAGSPAWLPRFRDESFVRFMNQAGPTADQGSDWGPLRIVYLQYASDPVTFFDYHDLYREPDWMKFPRGPDVSPELRWYPVVTFLQLALDMAMAATTPIGYGHVFAPAHYVDAWAEVSDIHGWSADEIAKLKRHLTR